MEIKIILTFIAGIVAAYVAFWNAERKITIDNITKERAKWREKIRETALEIHKAIISGSKKQIAELKSRFRLLLNPEDEEDEKILHLICIKNEKEREEQAEMFSIRVSYLLKHDWERAKLESKSLFKRLRFLHEGVKPPFDFSHFVKGLQVCFRLAIFKRICGLNPPKADKLSDAEYS